MSTDSMFGPTPRSEETGAAPQLPRLTPGDPDLSEKRESPHEVSSGPSEPPRARTEPAPDRHLRNDVRTRLRPATAGLRTAPTAIAAILAVATVGALLLLAPKRHQANGPSQREVSAPSPPESTFLDRDPPNAGRGAAAPSIGPPPAWHQGFEVRGVDEDPPPPWLEELSKDPAVQEEERAARETLARARQSAVVIERSGFHAKATSRGAGSATPSGSYGDPPGTTGLRGTNLDDPGLSALGLVVGPPGPALGQTSIPNLLPTQSSPPNPVRSDAPLGADGTLETGRARAHRPSMRAVPLEPPR